MGSCLSQGHLCKVKQTAWTKTWTQITISISWDNLWHRHTYTKYIYIYIYFFKKKTKDRLIQDYKFISIPYFQFPWKIPKELNITCIYIYIYIYICLGLGPFPGVRCVSSCFHPEGEKVCWIVGVDVVKYFFIIQPMFWEILFVKLWCLCNSRDNWLASWNRAVASWFRCFQVFLYMVGKNVVREFIGFCCAFGYYLLLYAFLKKNTPVFMGVSCDNVSFVFSQVFVKSVIIYSDSMFKWLIVVNLTIW